MKNFSIDIFLKKAIFLVVVMFSTTISCHSKTSEIPPGWPWHGVSMDFPVATPEDIERYRNDLDFNTVRLQVKVRKYARKHHVSSDVAFSVGLKWLDSMLDTCAVLNIYCVVNISDFPINPAQPNQNSRKFWETKELREDVLNITTRLVAHLKNRGAEFVAYDIMSEPVLKDGRKILVPKQWGKLLEDVVNIIKSSDPKRWVIVAPAPYGEAEAYKNFVPPVYDHLIWGAHMYRPHVFTHQGIKKNKIYHYPGQGVWRWWDVNRSSLKEKWDISGLKNQLQPLKDFEKKHPAPVWIGEFSAVRWAEGGEQYIHDLVSIFNEYGWGWTYFSATGWHGWNPDYNQHYPGKDRSNKGAWKRDFVGNKSTRWDTLREIFGVRR